MIFLKLLHKGAYRHIYLSFPEAVADTVQQGELVAIYGICVGIVATKAQNVGLHKGESDMIIRITRRIAQSQSPAAEPRSRIGILFI